MSRGIPSGEGDDDRSPGDSFAGMAINAPDIYLTFILFFVVKGGKVRRNIRRQR
jgi:hypothetical protein